jgi:hypothetical protein
MRIIFSLLTKTWNSFKESENSILLEQPTDLAFSTVSLCTQCCLKTIGSTAAPGGCKSDSECPQPEFPFVCPSFSCNLASNTYEQSCNCDLIPGSGETRATCPSDFFTNSELLTDLCEQ